MASPTFARGVMKTVAIAQETALGTPATATAQFLRRTGIDLNLNVQEIASQEILPSQQVRDSRQGPRGVSGTIAGQLSCASYKMLFEGLLRASFAPGALVGGLADASWTNNADGTATLGSASSNFLSAGIRRGDVVRPSALVAPAAGDNGQNLIVTNVAPNALTVAVPGAGTTAFASGQTETLTVAGKKLFMPASGQVFPSYTIEQWYADVGISDVFVGNRVTQINLNIPAAGYVSFQAMVSGLNAITTGVQAYPTATPATGTSSLTAVGGKVIYKGAPIAAITGMSVQLAADAQAENVVGSNIAADIFMGTFRVRGSFTALLAADGLTNDFLNEAEVELQVLMTDSPLPTANFVSLYLPRVKLMSSTKTDSDRAITRSFNFVALEMVQGGAGTQWDATSVVVQDSLA